MTEQLKHSTTDQYSYKSETDNKNKLHITQRGRKVRAGGIALSATLLTGVAVMGVDNILAERPVGSPVTVRIDQGETPIDAVTDGAHQIAEANNIDFNTLRDIVYAGQEVAGELGHPVQANVEITVEAVENGLGHRTIRADPANLAHLDK